MTAPDAADLIARYSRDRVLGGPWPTGAPGDGTTDIIVDSEAPPAPPTRFRDLQQAVDEAIRDQARQETERRRTIVVRPGFYPGPVVIPPSAPPLTILGPGADRATLAAGIDAFMSGVAFAARFGARFAHSPPAVREIHARIAARQRIGTGNTAVLRIERDDTRVTGLTIRNDYACDRAAAAPAGAEPDARGRYAEGQHQAVALHVVGADRVHLAALTLSSFQDTLYLQAGNGETASRVHLDNCLIEGDVDFVFGGATGFFERCEIRSRGSRGARSWALAPSTAIRQLYGFVFDRCRFTHDGAETGRTGRSFLGRQWFEGVRATPYGTPTVHGYRTLAADRDRYDPPEGRISRRALEAVGKCAVLHATFGAHLSPDRLWDDWAAGAWTPRHRPAQHGAADFLHYLRDWLTDQNLDYADMDPSEAWLLTHGCVWA